LREVGGRECVGKGIVGEEGRRVVNEKGERVGHAWETGRSWGGLTEEGDPMRGEKSERGEAWRS
jgi:hypothetical protein